LIIADGASFEGEICVPWRPVADQAPPAANGTPA
jgi:hypothetical protein